jgi:DNA-binding LytR/AlgR family response regulator
VDYLVKPISFERFLKSVDKFFDLDTSRFSNAVSQNITIINIRADRKNFPVVLNEILFIESLDDYVKIHTKDKVLVTHENISTLEAKLPTSEFVRIHRSYLIAIQHITSFTSEFIEITGKQLPFGRAYKQIALKHLGYK